MSVSSPKPYFFMNSFGLSFRMARCTMATHCSVLLLANSCPNADLALDGTPSQNVYACVAGSNVPCSCTWTTEPCSLP
jgi:hypothetical protein